LILASILSMSQPLFFWAVLCALNSLSLALQMALCSEGPRSWRSRTGYGP